MTFFTDKIGVRIIPALMAFAALLIFLAPFTRGIINLGNCFGAAVTGILTAAFVFYDKTKHLIEFLWSKPLGKAVVCAGSAAVIAGAALAIVISAFMASAASDYPQNTDTTVVVLGCKVKNGAPSLMLKRRLDAAYDYLAAHDDVNVIVSGGQGSDEIISEARCMRDYLVSRGISSERIFMEDKSTNTSENLRFSNDIIIREDLPRKITIVTDVYHQLRAEMLADKYNMKAYNISAKTSWWLVPTYWVREWFGIVYYAIFG